MSGTRGKGEEQQGEEGGRVTGRDGGWRSWSLGGDNDIRCRRTGGRERLL